MSLRKRERVKKLARGKRLDEGLKERALSLLMMGESVADVARQLKLADSTVRSWRKAISEGEMADEFAKVRALKKEKFIANAWEIVERSQRLVRRRLERAEEDEKKFTQLMELLCEVGTDMSASEVNRIFRNIATLRLDDIRSLSTVMGTAYDKQALASGDPTENVRGSVGMKFEDL